MKSTSLIFLLVVSNILVFNSVVQGLSKSESVYFFDVGQGDGSLIRSEGIDILIDAGPGKKILSELEKALLNTDKYIDIVIISHPHADHYGGLDYILSDYEVGAIIFNGSESTKGFNAILDKARLKGIPIIKAFAGSSIKSRDLSLQVVYPPQGTDEELLSENDGSLVIFTALRALNGIFPGDIARKSEPVVSAVDFPKIDFLKVPHHGSNTSSSQTFLSAIYPAIAVLSVGKNSYGLPSEQALSRFDFLHIPIFRTDEEKGIIIEKEKETLKIKSLE